MNDRTVNAARTVQLNVHAHFNGELLGIYIFPLVSNRMPNFRIPPVQVLAHDKSVGMGLAGFGQHIKKLFFHCFIEDFLQFQKDFRIFRSM